MDSSIREATKDEPINDSWVDLHFQQQQQQSSTSSSLQSSLAPTSQPIPSGFSTPEMKAPAPPPLPGLCSGQMEQLLLEAQRESRGSSRFNSQPSSSRGSPKSPHSPNNEMVAVPAIPPIQEGQVLQAVQQIPTDWIWDWSSRPEALPHHNNGSSDGSTSRVYQHPRRNRLSVRNTPVMRSGGLYQHLSTLLMTHAASFIIGAAAMFLYLKKYCNWSPPIKSSAIFD